MIASYRHAADWGQPQLASQKLTITCPARPGPGRGNSGRRGGWKPGLTGLKLLAVSFQLLAALLATVLSGAAQAQALTLEEGLAVVASQGYDARIAIARESAARWSEAASRARLKPRVSAYADHTWLENRPEAIFGGGTSPLSEDRILRYGVNVRQLVTDFGKTRSGVDAARAGTRIRSAELLLARNGAALDLILSYIQFLQAQRNLALARQVVERHRSHLADAKAFHEAGEVTLNDVLAAEVALADAQVGLINAEDTVILSASRINFLVLRPLEEKVEGAEFGSPPVDLSSIEGILDAARESRVELKILDEQIFAAEARIRESESGRYPSLYLGGGYSFEENPYRVHEDNWSATVGLTWDLYTGGALKAGEGKASGELAALVAQREKVIQAVRLEVLDSRRLLTGAMQRAEVAEKAVKQAEESLRLQRARYGAAEASATEVTDAITSLARAELNHWSAIYGKQMAMAQLLYAMGSDMVEIYSSSNTSRLTAKETGD